MSTTTDDPSELLYVMIWAPAGKWAIDYRRAPYYRDPECHSCQRVGERLADEERSQGWMDYAFCGHVWDVAWQSCAARVTVSDGRVLTDSEFEGRADLALDLAATLVAAAEAAAAWRK